MTHRAGVFSAAVVLAIQGILAAPRAGAEVIERIVAIVNDEVVTEQDLGHLMAPVAAQYRTAYTGEEFSEKIENLRREFLQKAIEDKLILSEAKRRQVIVTDDEVDGMIDDVRNKFPNREIFLKAIEEQGLTEKKLWNRFRDQLMTQKLVGYEVRSRIAVSPGEVTEYYNARQSEFSQGERVRLQQILVRTESRPEEEAKTFAESLVAKLKDGRIFEELAKEYSEGIEAKEGGEMGWIEKGQLLGEIDRQVFSLGEGEVTAPIKSALGYHVFRVAGKQDASTRPLADVRDKIHDILLREKMSQRLDKWIEDLKKAAYISIRS